MNNQRVQTLEALLTRIKKNAGEPRPERARARAEAPVGAETRAAAAPKPVAEARTVPPAAPAKVAEPPKAAAAPVAPARTEPKAVDVAPSHAGPPKVTPRLIDPVTSADQDPAKWTLDEMGADPVVPPTPSPKPVAATPKAAPVEKAPVRSIPEARPSPRTGLGLGGFGKQIEAKKQDAAKVEPKPATKAIAPPIERQETPKAPPARVEPSVSLDIDEPTTMEEKAHVPSLAEAADAADEEVEATVSGPIPTHIIEMSRAVAKSKPEPVAEAKAPAIEVAPPAIETAPVVEPSPPEPKKGLGHTIPLAIDAPDVDVAVPTNVTIPMQPTATPEARTPDPEPAPKPEPVKAEPPKAEPVKAEPAKPEPKVVPVAAAAETGPEVPAFSNGGTTDAPSKFVADAVAAPKQGSSSFVKTLIVAVVVILAAVAVYVYLRRDEFFGGAKPTDSGQPPPASSGEPKTTPATSASTPATQTSAATPPVSAEPSASAAPATSASSAPAAGAPGDPPKDPKQLGPTQGYLFVQTAQEGEVYAGGVRIGPANEWIISPCKAAFLGLGKKAGGGVQWVIPGRTVQVPCQDKLVHPLP